MTLPLLSNIGMQPSKLVRVIGFVRLEFEGNVIYVHLDDLKYGLTKNGLWLNITDQIRKERDKYTDKYVLVEGTCNSQNHGHMGLNSGEIEQITSSLINTPQGLGLRIS